MKTILGLIGGGDRDAVILQTAYAVAAPIAAHLDFLHVHVSAGIAAQYDDAVQFAVGPAISNSFDTLTKNAKRFSEVAERHVRDFCASLNVEMCEASPDHKKVTATFREENDISTKRLIEYAQQSDLVVLGRASQTQGLAFDTLELLVRNCLRPVLVAAATPPQTLLGTIMVCWKELDNVARAVTAAMPILKRARCVIFSHVSTHRKESVEIAEPFIRQLAQNGVSTRTLVVPANHKKIPTLLAAAADDCDADLVLIGAYSRSQIHELIFDSCTDALLRDIDRPLLLMH